jgi:predicted N-formylglutamate amidohydrolase
LLGPDDPPPFEPVNPDGAAALLLVCDHASHAVPAALQGLGLDESMLKRHIGWDIGAADVTRRLAALLDAPALLAGYSRLVIDCNRPIGAPSSIATVSDGVTIPGNAALDGPDAAARSDACFAPYHDAVEEMLDKRDQPAFISMHSFTPLFDGFERPWHIGILWDQDDRLSKPLMAALAPDQCRRQRALFGPDAAAFFHTAPCGGAGASPCHRGNPPGPYRHPSRRRDMGATVGGGLDQGAVTCRSTHQR